MKSVLMILALCFVAAAMGEVTEPTKTRITCSADSKYKVYNPKGELVQDEAGQGKVSESIRTAWVDGDTEVRSSKSKSFRDGGKTLAAISRSLSRIIKVTNADGTITEKSEVSSISVRQDEIQYAGGAKTEARELKSEDTYRQEGSVKTYLKSVTNGIENKAGSTETERVISPDLKIVTYIEPAQESVEKDGTRIVTEKYEMNCAFETIKTKK